MLYLKSGANIVKIYCIWAILGETFVRNSLKKIVLLSLACIFQQVSEVPEILAQDDSDALRGESIVDGIIAIVVMTVGFGTDGAARIHQEFNVKVADEGTVLIVHHHRVLGVAISEVARHEEAVVEQTS